MVLDEQWINQYIKVFAANGYYDDEMLDWINEQITRVNNLEITLLEIRFIATLKDVKINKNDIFWLEQYEEIVKNNYKLDDLKGKYTRDGKNLFIWIHEQKRKYKEGKLSQSKIKKLEELGIEWNVLEKTEKLSWNKYYSLCKEYYEENGTIVLPNSFVYKDIDIGKWLRSQKDNYLGIGRSILCSKEKQKLDDLGMIWKPYIQAEWEYFILMMSEFVNEKKLNNEKIVLNMNTTYKNYHIGEKYFKYKTTYKNGFMSQDKIKELAKLGIRFS